MLLMRLLMGDVLELGDPDTNGPHGEFVDGEISKNWNRMVAYRGFSTTKCRDGSLFLDRHEPGFENFPYGRNLCFLALFHNTWTDRRFPRRFPGESLTPNVLRT